LAQHDQVKGYKKAIFSGLPTVELAEVIHNRILPKPALHGLYHVSANPVAKFDLLNMVAKAYEKEIVIQPDDEIVIDRSLDSSLFHLATGYQATDWPDLIEKMRQAR
jgi:dTDP-4-dehydrorhamnose reductase